MKFKLECSEANHICDKSQYREAGFWEKVRLNIHLIYCRACRQYTMNNSKLTKAIKRSEIKSMDNSAKSALKEQLNKELLK
jgi:hypothetical protein